MLGAILGDDRNSRLYWALRHTGLAEDAGGGYWGFTDAGLMAVSAACDPDKSKKVADIMRTETAKLRCVEIDPRHLSFMELERGDCRYPYGGDTDGEAITFCGHPRREGSSYCTPHFYLTCGPGTAAERSACSVLFRILRDARRARTETDAETRVAR